MPARFCNYCGNFLPENARFCGNCGKLVAIQEPKPVPAPVPVEEPQVIPAPVPVEEPRVAAIPAGVMSLDTLEEVKPRATVFSLESLLVEEEPAPAPAEPEVKPVQPVAVPTNPVAERPKAAPVQTAPKVAPVQPAKPKKQWQKRGAVRTVLAVLVCTLIFVWSFASISVLNLRVVTTGELGAQVLESTIEEITLDQIGQLVIIGEVDDPGEVLTDWIAEQIDVNYSGKVVIEARDLQKFWEKSTLPSFLAAYLGDFVTDIATGSSNAEITEKDVRTLLKENAELLDDIFGEELTNEDIDQIAEAAVDSGVLDVLSADEMKQTAGIAYTAVQSVLSWWLIGIFGLILGLLILLLGAVNGNILRTCGDTGITLMVSSGLWCLAGLFTMALPALWESLFAEISLIGTVSRALLSACLVPSAIVFGVGLALLLVKVIGKKIMFKSAAVQA